MTTHMLCRVRVRDYDKWLAIFQSHRAAHEAAGMKLLRISRELGDPGNVFFSFELEDVERAKAFIEAPEAAQSGAESGVIDGEYHFVEGVAGYGDA